MIYNAQVDLGPSVNLSEAVDLLNKAVARDPNFFLAYCQLAFAHDLILEEIDHPRALGPGKVGHRFCISVEAGFGGSAPGAGVAPLLGAIPDYDRARAELALAQQSLPNNPQVYELAGSIDRSQRRWAEATHNLERACELDPRNLPYLITLATTYLWLHDYDQMARVIDRIVAVQPDRSRPRIIRAGIEVDRRADTGPLRAAIEKILTNEPGSEKDPFVAGQRYTLALYDRDLATASSVAAGLSQKNSLEWSLLKTPLGRDFWVGVVARLEGDETSARAAFMRGTRTTGGRDPRSP